MGYNVATFGNHEFDWGQVNLLTRIQEATYPYVTANIVPNATMADCASQLAGRRRRQFAATRTSVKTVGTAPNTVKVAFIGVTTTETPTITVATATAGLCFKDPAESILHYYDAMKAAGADVIVVLSHLGFTDGGYGYGIPVYGDQTLADKLNTAGKPANLIIGGHSHSNLTAATMVGNTAIVQAYYNGRTVGRADVTVSHYRGASRSSGHRKTERRHHRRHPRTRRSLLLSIATRPIRTTWRWSTRRSDMRQSTCCATNNGDNMMGTSSTTPSTTT